LAIRFVNSARSVSHRGWRQSSAWASSLIVAALAPLVRDAWAKAPDLATTLLDTEPRVAPDCAAALIPVKHKGTEVELTGQAAPGLPDVYYDGQAVWVPAQHFSLGVRPGIDSDVTVAEAPPLEASMRDASVLETILEGQAVILTGTTLDRHDAAAHVGSRGWVDQRDLSR
jgi:hypothetical protein